MPPIVENPLGCKPGRLSRNVILKVAFQTEREAQHIAGLHV